MLFRPSLTLSCRIMSSCLPLLFLVALTSRTTAAPGAFLFLVSTVAAAPQSPPPVAAAPGEGEAAPAGASRSTITLLIAALSHPDYSKLDPSGESLVDAELPMKLRFMIHLFRQDIVGADHARALGPDWTRDADEFAKRVTYKYSPQMATCLTSHLKFGINTGPDCAAINHVMGENALWFGLFVKYILAGNPDPHGAMRALSHISGSVLPEAWDRVTAASLPFLLAWLDGRSKLTDLAAVLNPLVMENPFSASELERMIITAAGLRHGKPLSLADLRAVMTLVTTKLTADQRRKLWAVDPDLRVLSRGKDSATLFVAAVVGKQEIDSDELEAVPDEAGEHIYRALFAEAVDAACVPAVLQSPCRSLSDMARLTPLMTAILLKHAIPSRGLAEASAVLRNFGFPFMPALTNDNLGDLRRLHVTALANNLAMTDPIGPLNIVAKAVGDSGRRPLNPVSRSPPRPPTLPGAPGGPALIPRSPPISPPVPDLGTS